MAVALVFCGAVAFGQTTPHSATPAVVDASFPRWFSMRPIWGRSGMPSVLIGAPTNSVIGNPAFVYFQVNPMELWEGKLGVSNVTGSGNSLFLESGDNELGQSVAWEPDVGTVQGALVVEKMPDRGRGLSMVQSVRVWESDGELRRIDLRGFGVLTSPRVLDSFVIRKSKNDDDRTLGVSGWVPIGGDEYQLGVWLMRVGADNQVVGDPEFLAFQREAGGSVVEHISQVSKAEVSMEVGYTEKGLPFGVGIVTIEKQVHTFTMNQGDELRPLDLRHESSLDGGWPFLMSSAASQAGIASDEFFVRSRDPQYMGLYENPPWQFLSLSGDVGLEEKWVSVRVELPASELLPRGSGPVEGMGITRDAQGSMMGVAVVIDDLFADAIRAFGFQGEEFSLEADTVGFCQIRTASFARSRSVLCRVGAGNYLLISPSAAHYYERTLPLPSKGSLSMLLLREEVAEVDGESVTSLVPIQVKTISPEEFFPLCFGQ